LLYRYFVVGKSAVPVSLLSLYNVPALVSGNSVTLLLFSSLN